MSYEIITDGALPRWHDWAYKRGRARGWKKWAGYEVPEFRAFSRYANSHILMEKWCEGYLEGLKEDVEY